MCQKMLLENYKLIRIMCQSGGIMKRKVLKIIMLLVIVCIFLLNRKNGDEHIEVVNANEVISVY